MNEEFEKILGRIQEKLCKSEERYHRYLDDSDLSCVFDKSDIEEKMVDTIKEILEIVREVAEEYKGGWIPCSKELPQQNELMRVWLSFTNKICPNNKTYSYVKRAIWCYDHFEYDNGKVVSDTPIAWKKYYAPEPYQPKGEL